MIEANLANIQRFIEGYQVFSKSIDDDKYAFYRNKFDGFIGGYQILTDVLSMHNTHFAAHYNVFSILNISHREVKTHTPILKNLLDVRGEHAQNELFYTKFIDTIFEETDRRRKVFGSFSKQFLEVIEELPTLFGRIDIFIRHYNNENPFCIAIENKIYAPDQPKQVERYHKYMKDGLGLAEDRMLLIYLSPNGRDPTEDSIGKADCERLKKNGVLRCVSYQNEIKKWLESCSQDVKATSIQTILNQYIKTITTL